MKILYTASEVAPFIKTGGLADVAGSLPQALAAQGHEVRVVLPLYEGISQEWRDKMEFLFHFDVWVSWRNSYCGVFSLVEQGVTYYFIDNEHYFKRGRIYGHFDDCERFAFFCQGVMALPGRLDWAPDILHANDWQTALVPIYLLERRYHVEQFGQTASVFTIHNVEYQGRFSKSVLSDVLGLGESYFNANMLEYYGDINLMKGAIMATHFINTVSPTYANELKIPFYAHGLHDVISSQAHKLQGILNGLDVELYNPKTDSNLCQNFDENSLEGKAKCKEALQSALGLRVEPETPIIACVSRLAEHKGFALVVDGIKQIMDMGAQVVVLGTGNYEYEEAFRHAAEQYPGMFSAQLAYSASLSNLIYAGADMFLMPSFSEPCGLSQMISMRYGTVPIVRETGGLRDSVVNFDLEEGTGFTFANINTHDMLYVIEEAVELYRNNKDHWYHLQKNGMTADFSWTGSALAYGEIYEKIKILPPPPPVAEPVRKTKGIKGKAEDTAEKKPAKKLTKIGKKKK
ncbi:MAG: glycogen synthase GlgA [Eubacteriales bacterium]